MNWTQIEGNWQQLKGIAREKWGQLTDEDLDMIAGRRDQLIGRLKKAYGYTQEQAEEEVESFVRGASHSGHRFE